MPPTPPFHPRLIIGIGNPGREYERTYHNAGIAAVHLFLAKKEMDGDAPRHATHFDYWKLPSLIIAHATTYMNDSGLAGEEAQKKFGVAPEHILVVHDESDLPLGTTRCVFGRGAAGHRGVISIINRLGTKNFWRFRIGIRTGNEKAEHIVLRKIQKKDSEVFYRGLDAFTKKVMENESP